MPGLRAVMVTVPPLLADMVRQLLAEHMPIEVVATITRRDRLAERARALAPDLLILGLRRGEDDRVARFLLEAMPRARVIAITGDARTAYVHEMRPYRAVLDDLSPGALLAGIRGELHQP